MICHSEVLDPDLHYVSSDKQLFWGTGQFFGAYTQFCDIFLHRPAVQKWVHQNYRVIYKDKITFAHIFLH